MLYFGPSGNKLDIECEGRLLPCKLKGYIRKFGFCNYHSEIFDHLLMKFGSMIGIDYKDGQVSP